MAGSIPEFDHGLGDDLDALRDVVRSFTAKEIAPRAAEIDRGDEVRVRVRAPGNVSLRH